MQNVSELATLAHIKERIPPCRSGPWFNGLVILTPRCVPYRSHGKDHLRAKGA